MNYKKLCKPYRQDALLALSRLCSIPSVYDEASIGPSAPFGSEVKKALDYVAALGEEYGFKVDKCDGYCTELSYGEGPKIGIFAHTDVVPASGEWVSAPFEPEIRGKKLYARGTSDDKGPLMAALFGLKALKDNGLIKGFSVSMVVGGNEENGSACLEHYFHVLKKEGCVYAFTPDAEFPLVHAEKGMVGECYATKMIDLAPITYMEGGSATNAVCDALKVYLPKDEKLVSYLNLEGVSYEEKEDERGHYILFKGLSAHGSTPEKGVNAALKAFEALGNFYSLPFLSLLATLLKDPSGKNFGGYEYSPVLGPTTYNYGLFHYEDKVLKFSIDHRYGEKGTPKENLAAFEEKTTMSVAYSGGKDVLLWPTDSPIVKTLMKVYRKQTGDLLSKPLAIGGGTYAKEAPNCLAFGSAFKGHEGDIHSPNEYIYLSDFYRQIPIYAAAVMALGELAIKEGK